jgi:hypothetical protein
MKINRPLEYRYRPELDPSRPEYDEEAVRIDQEWHMKTRLAIQIQTIKAINEAYEEVLGKDK